MRFPILAFLFVAFTTAAASAADAPNARAAYVERRGLIEADARCQLFTPGVRAALEAGAAQARGALLRAGWSSAQVRELESAVVSAAHGRACTDARTASAAAEARSAFADWVNASSMSFPGWERTWTARRVVGADGWRLRQPIDAPIAATFGVRDRAGEQRLVLVVPLARGQRAPLSAQILMRDARRTAPVEVDLSQRVAYGLAAGAPSPSAATSVQSTRSIEQLEGGLSQAVFMFPDTTFAAMVALDPRESIELRLGLQRLFVEVGDIVAARAFLTARAD